MTRFRIPLAILLLLIGCHRAKPPVVEAGPTDWPGASPLTDAEIADLGVTDQLIALLPHGRGTPVLRLPATGAKPEGFSFSVSPDGIGLTIHALRRQLGAREPAPLIYGIAGPSPEVHDGVAVLLHKRSELEALQLETDSKQSERVLELNKFLLRWHPSTRVSLLMATPEVAWLEVAWLPDGDESDEFLKDLASFMSDDVDNVDLPAMRDDLVHGDPVAIRL